MIATLIMITENLKAGKTEHNLQKLFRVVQIYLLEKRTCIWLSYLFAAAGVTPSGSLFSCILENIFLHLMFHERILGFSMADFRQELFFLFTVFKFLPKFAHAIQSFLI